jgi:hypothetical protein
MDWNEIPHDQCLLGDPLGASKWFLRRWHVQREQCTCLASRLALSPNGSKRASTSSSLPRSSIGCVHNDFWACWYVCHKPCTCLATRLALSPNRPKQASKAISKLRLAQTMHLYCTDTNTVSKWIEPRFHMTNFTEETHRVCPKRFLNLWYVCHKPCTYLSVTLTLSPNGLKWDSTWPMSPRRCIRCVQNDFWDDGTFGANRAAILRQG